MAGRVRHAMWYPVVGAPGFVQPGRWRRGHQVVWVPYGRRLGGVDERNALPPEERNALPPDERNALRPPPRPLVRPTGIGRAFYQRHATDSLARFDAASDVAKKRVQNFRSSGVFLPAEADEFERGVPKLREQLATERDQVFKMSDTATKPWSLVTWEKARANLTNMTTNRINQLNDYVEVFSSKLCFADKKRACLVASTPFSCNKPCERRYGICSYPHEALLAQYRGKSAVCPSSKASSWF